MKKGLSLLSTLLAFLLVIFYQNCASDLSNPNNSGVFNGSSFESCADNPNAEGCEGDINQTCTGEDCDQSDELKIIIDARKISDSSWDSSLSSYGTFPFAHHVTGVRPNSEFHDKVRFKAVNVEPGAKVCFAMRDVVSYGAGDQDDLVTGCNSQNDFEDVADAGNYNSGTGTFTKTFNIIFKECVMRNMFIYNPGDFANRIDLGYFTSGEGFSAGGPCPSDAVRQ